MRVVKVIDEKGQVQYVLDISPEELEIFDQIKNGNRACASYEPGPIMDGLLADGFLDLWPVEIPPLSWFPSGGKIKGGPYVTFSPYAAEILNLEVRERERCVWVDEEIKDENGKTRKIHTKNLDEVPYWSDRKRPKSRLGPRIFHKARMCSLTRPELVPDRRSKPIHMCDETGNPLLIQNRMILIDKRMSKAFR